MIGHSIIRSGPVRLALAVLLFVFVILLGGGLYASQRQDDFVANQTAIQWAAVQASNQAQRLSLQVERFFAGDEAVDLDQLAAGHDALMAELKSLREAAFARELFGHEGLGARIKAMEADLDKLGDRLRRLQRDDRDALSAMRSCLERSVTNLTDTVAVAVRKLAGPHAVSRWGNLLHLLYFLIVIAAAGLVFLAAVVIAENTKNRRLAERYKTAMAEADAANRAKSRLLANVSHELRTPLNAIIGFSDILRDQIFGAIGNERYIDYAAHIRDSGTHLLLLVNDLLDYAKHDDDGVRLSFKPIPLVEIIKEAIHMCTPNAEGRKVSIDFRGDATPTVLADLRAIRQISTNLICNAVEHSPEGATVDVRVTISADMGEHSGSTVLVEVLDRGQSISDEEAERLLRPFEWGQADSYVADPDGGAGFGLALAHKLAEKHGDGVTLSARTGGGTIAAFGLPLVKKTAPG